MVELARKRTFLDFFPAPDFLLLSTSGIVINDYDTKFVALQREILGDGFKLAHSSQTINPAGAIVAGNINKQEEISKILKELAVSHHLRYVHATLPEEKAYLFNATIDWVPNEGLEDAVAFIVEENAPVSLEESVFYYDIMSEDKVENKIKVAVAVLPKEVVNSYVSLFESAGITPVSFAIESQAIARSVVALGDTNQYLIVNLSPKKTGFYITRGNVVEFSTTPSYGIDPDDSTKNIDDLRDELQKVLTFWETHKGEDGEGHAKISKIIICGFGANKKEFVERLMANMSIPHTLGDAWINLSASSRKHLSQDLLDKSLDYASAIGLALSCDI